MTVMWPTPTDSGSSGGAHWEEHADQDPGQRGRQRRWWRWTAIGFAALLALVLAASYALYTQLDGNLNIVNVFGGLRNRPPASPAGAENILLLGSQTRDGQLGGQAEFGTAPGTDLSDNLILVHLDATRSHATIVSIPRDTMVYEPACKSRQGRGMVPPMSQAIIDGAMNLGGPACAVATVEHLSDIRIDHFVRFTFNSFRDMTNVLGGVEVCLPQPVNDSYSHLHMSAGRHFITGDQALEFVRTRHGVGDGSDLGRIELQQEFISSMMQKLQSQGTLDNPVKLLEIAEVATRSLTVDQALGSVSALLSQAYSVRHLHAKNITFITMPTQIDPANTNRLLPMQPEDDNLWHMLKTGTLWHGHLPVPPPHQVQVTVLNGTGRSGLAGITAARLRALGYDVTATGNAVAVATTKVTYAGSLGGYAAYGLLGALDAAQPTVTDTLLAQPADAQTIGNPRVTLTLGGDFRGVRAPAPPAKPGSAKPAPARPAPRHRHARRQAAVPSSVQTAPTPGGVAIQTRNGAANICSGLPGANPFR